MKKWKRLGQVLLMLSGCLGAFPVTCNSIFAKSKKTADDDYEYVTPTGSMVPQRVKKGEAAIPNGPMETMSVQEFEKMRQRLPTGGKLPAGGP